MTVVIAQIKDGKSCMASDSLDHDNSLRYKAPKIVRIKDRLLIGVSGLAKLYDIVADINVKSNISIDSKYLSRLGQSCFERLRDELVVTKPEDIEAELLFLTEDGIFSMSIDSPIYEHKDFWAIGSGQKLAIGCMEGGGDIKAAVECACKYDPNCGKPAVLEILK